MKSFSKNKGLTGDIYTYVHILQYFCTIIHILYISVSRCSGTQKNNPDRNVVNRKPSNRLWEPHVTSLGEGHPMLIGKTTAWLGLTIPTPSDKQCQGRGWAADRDILYIYIYTYYEGNPLAPVQQENRYLPQ